MVCRGVVKGVQMRPLHATVREVKDMINYMADCVAFHPNDVVRMHVHVYASKLGNFNVLGESENQKQVKIGGERNYKIQMERDSNMLPEELSLV